MMKRTFKTHEKHGLVLSIAAASLALGLVVGCANQDPTSQYADLNATVKPHTEVAEKQALVDRSFIIETEKDLMFVAGETKSFIISVRIDYTSITSYDVKVTGMQGLVVKPTGEPGKFKATWAVAESAIPTDQQRLDVPYTIELQNVRSSDPKTEQIFRQIYKTREFATAVVRSSALPTIVGEQVAGLPKEVKQGEMSKFKVVVEDKASYSDLAPKIEASLEAADKVSQAYVSSGAAYIVMDNVAPKFLGGKRWEFTGALMTTNNPAGVQQDDAVTVMPTRMNLKVVGVGGVSSRVLPVAVAIKMTEKPSAEPKAEAATEVKTPSAKAKAAPKAASVASVAKSTAAPKASAKNSKSKTASVPAQSASAPAPSASAPASTASAPQAPAAAASQSASKE